MGEPYRFTGPQGTNRKYGGNKGVMRQVKELKRKEAEQRQKLSKKEVVTDGSVDVDAAVGD